MEFKDTNMEQQDNGTKQNTLHFILGLMHACATHAQRT